MKTYIFPGFSSSNKEWTVSVKKELDENDLPTEVYEWKHWQTGEKEEDWIDKEVERIIDKVGEEKINIIAKSIGTLVAMRFLKKKQYLINKLILCGIPLYDISEEDKGEYENIKQMSLENILCIQNENDNHGTFSEVNEFVDSINSEIKVISMPRSDHDYPYMSDFIQFLK